MPRDHVELVMKGVDAANRGDPRRLRGLPSPRCGMGGAWGPATGDDRVLLETLSTARGGASGAETELRAWNVFWFADGKIARRQGPFGTRDEALEAAGIRA
jgi:hypothetical protein